MDRKAYRLVCFYKLPRRRRVDERAASASCLDIHRGSLGSMVHRKRSKDNDVRIHYVQHLETCGLFWEPTELGEARMRMLIRGSGKGVCDEWE